MSSSLRRDGLAVLAGMAISILSGLLGPWLDNWSALTRLDPDTGFAIFWLLGCLVDVFAGFVVARLASMRAVWIFAVVYFVYSIAASIQFWGVLSPRLVILPAALIIPCALLGGIVGSRMAPKRIRS